MDAAKVREGFNDFLGSQLSRPSTTLNTKRKAELIRKYLLGGSYNHKYTLMVCCGNIFLPVLDLLLLSVTQYICFNNVANTCMLLI